MSAGSPDIYASDFSLGRKLAVARNCWAVPLNLAAAASNAVLFILPSATQGLVIPMLTIDASVASVFRIGLATSVTTPTALTPLNMNLSAANVASFTAQSATSSATGFTSYMALDLPAASAYPPIYLGNDAPFILPAGSTNGFCVQLGTAITGTVRVTAIVQEYPY